MVTFVNGNVGVSGSRNERGRGTKRRFKPLEETWAAMENLVDEGLTGAIGLSDIDVEGAKRIIDTARLKPAVVEAESHPYHPQSRPAIDRFICSGAPPSTTGAGLFYICGVICNIAGYGRRHTRAAGSRRSW
ncbi:aldo/keto reductase [Mycobacterium sp.]|jgi:hypothetical protein|uniref:aldo/keto reductase n=1 Tax=Mycobacterium sp. TaxID=1785 RepID=UPI0039C95969